MSRATHAILKHNQDAATGEKSHQPIKGSLPRVVVKVVQPVFEQLVNSFFLVASNA